MATFKTPGVYIEEIPTLGSSIAGVPTAITGFVGYTEKAIIDGTQWTYPGYISGSAPGEAAPPVRITSLLEFQEIFGGSFSEKFQVTLTGTVSTPTTIAVVPKSVIPANTLTNFILFYQVQMFFANGGGTCWIVSTGKYITPFPTTALLTTALSNGMDKFEQIDEVTILTAPEAVFLTTIGQRSTVYNKMAVQCAKLQDRFAILDTVHNGNTTVTGNNTIFEDATDFRNNDIGPDNLKYVAAYYPALDTPMIYSYIDQNVAIVDNRTQGPVPNNYNYTSPYNTLSSILNGNNAFYEYTVPLAYGQFTPGPTPDAFKINVGTSVTLEPFNGTPPDENKFDNGSSALDSVNNLIAAINAHSVLSQFVIATLVDDAGPIKFHVTARIVGTPGQAYEVTTLSGGAYNPALPNVNLIEGIGADIALYNRIKDELNKYTLSLYPCASMAGIYARVDGTRGVWKAPANVGLALANEPSITIDDESQENLNVDSVSGKSINAIRQFSGRGTLVWGARTLAGNDNEWRYINVRRLFTYVEESCKKATEFVVFESNTAVTWNRVKNMVEAFLTNLWRDGALAGATTKDAFFVQVGLGSTMTPDDILNGKMIVTIGMAAARPAEFIILQFEHKLQES
jgi:phage tail sheath protein FI